MNTEDTVIDIRLPLPIDVVSTLMLLVGSAYPDSTLIEQGRHGYSMGFKIPSGSRAKKVSKSAIAKLKQDASELDGFEVTEASPNGFAWATPQHVANMLREVLETSFQENPDGTNYLEWEVQSGDNKKHYLLTFCRSKGQSPHALRMTAEAKLAVAEARIRELEGVRS